MSGIDYSKWDKIVADMSDSEEDNQDQPNIDPSMGMGMNPGMAGMGMNGMMNNLNMNNFNMDNFNMNDFNMNNFMQRDEALSSKHANVTKLTKPSSVTIGPQGATITPKMNKQETETTQNQEFDPSNFAQTLHDKFPKPSASDKYHNSKDSIPKSSNPFNSSLHQQQKPKQAEDEKEEVAQSISMSLSSLLSKWTHNGGIHKFEYLWSQTADELVVRILIPSTTKGKHVKINFNAESKQFKCNVVNSNNKLNINKTFARKLKESDEEDANLDWELCDIPVFSFDNQKLKDVLKDILGSDELCMDYVSKLSSCRFLKISLEKEKINDRIIEWWDNVFVDDTKIDLNARIKDRKTDANKMKEIWNNAHKGFKERIADIQPQEIVVPEENENDDDDDGDIDLVDSH